MENSEPSDPSRRLMRLSTSQFSQPWSLSAAVAAVIAMAPTVHVHADEIKRAGRYIDRSVLVHGAAQLNPLEQVANLQFTSRITVGEALRTALVGTGYRLLDPDRHPHFASRRLLESRLAIPHQNFAEKRIDSVIAALIGAGRSFAIEVDHVARRVRVVPILPADTPVQEAPADPPPRRRHFQTVQEQGAGR